MQGTLERRARNRARESKRKTETENNRQVLYFFFLGRGKPSVHDIWALSSFPVAFPLGRAFDIQMFFSWWRARPGSSNCVCTKVLYFITPYKVLRVVSDTNECNASVAVCDVLHGICHNTLDSYLCSCDAGFTGDGKTCTGKLR